MTLQLRDYQREFFQRVRERYDAGITRQLGVLATGLGKAVLFAALRDQMNFRKKIMVLVHREELANQAADKLQRWNPDLMVGVEKAERTSSPMDTFIVASVPTLGRARSKRILKFHRDDFDCVVSDECFPAGTLIDGKPIETIRIGEAVLSYDESNGTIEKRGVSRIYRNPMPEYLVLVKTADGNFTCTAEHPIYTQKGWINAIDLTSDDRLLFSLHWRRGPLHPITRPHDAIREKGQGLLLGFLQGSICGTSQFGAHDADQLRALFGSYEDEQSHAESGIERKDDRNTEGDGTQALSARGERDGTHETAADARSSVGVGNGGWRSYWQRPWQWLSDRLQAGCWEPRPQGRCGGRRDFSRDAISTGTGPEEGCASEWVRVDGIEVQERPNPQQSSGRPECDYVYNLEVEETHTYFANGFLVHNCHHATGAQWRNVLEYFGLLRPGESQILSLGLTATPNRSDGQGLRQFFDEIVFDMGIRSGIESGWLVDLRGVRVSTKTNLDKVHSRAGDFAEDELSDAVNTVERNAIIVKEWMRVAYGFKTVVFTVDIQHALDLAAAFKQCSIEAEAVWGDDPERARKLQRHRENALTVLCNCAVLTEGYDDPGIKCIVLAKPTKSQLLFTQMIGRGTRIDDGKEYTLIMDVVDNTSKHSLVTMPSLLGLPTNLDLKGKSVIRAKEQFEKVAKEFPSADLSEVLSLSKLDAIAEDIALFQVHYPPEVSKLSEFGWRKNGDGYMLVVNRGVVTITKDLRDEYQIRGNLNGAQIEYSAQNLPGAFNIADAMVPKEFTGLVKRDARWHGDKPTEKQLSLARILRLAVPPGATKGQVSAAIDAKRSMMRTKV
jgi:superfamily II DNA or RNA helicase